MTQAKTQYQYVDDGCMLSYEGTWSYTIKTTYDPSQYPIPIEKLNIILAYNVPLLIWVLGLGGDYGAQWAPRLLVYQYSFRYFQK